MTHAGLTADDLIAIEAGIEHRTVRVSVSDDGPGFEIPQSPAGDLEEGASGSRLLTASRTGWGVELDCSNAVWFEIDLP